MVLVGIINTATEYGVLLRYCYHYKDPLGG